MHSETIGMIEFSYLVFVTHCDLALAAVAGPRVVHTSPNLDSLSTLRRT